MTEDDMNKIYLMVSAKQGESNKYDEYVCVDGEWELLGQYEAAIDLTAYVGKDELSTEIATLPTLDEISKFVCIDKNGEAAGVMDKEQVASVLAGLIPFPFTRRMYINDANKDVESGYYRGNSSNLNTPVKYGILIVFSTIESYIVQLLIDVTSIRLWGRGSIDNGNSWTEWTQIGG